jgi:alanine racemase
LTRPINAIINLNNLKFNLEKLKGFTKSKLIVVAKANAYGHDLVKCIEILKIADGIAVLDLKDAINIRKSGYKGLILLLEGFFKESELKKIFSYEITPVIHSDYQVEILTKNIDLSPKKVFVKFNSGMNRLGFDLSRNKELLSFFKQKISKKNIFFMSHFADADNSRGIKWQLDRYRKKINSEHELSSFSNSATVLSKPTLKQTWIRPGIITYGVSPFSSQIASDFGYKPVMKLLSKIVAIQKIKKGETVGYGSKFKSKSDLKIGIIACGYGDGYPRNIKNGFVYVKEFKAKIVGVISMDLITVDITKISNVSIGTEVELWGDRIPIEIVAKNASTIPYELLVKVTSRVRRKIIYQR